VIQMLVVFGHNDTMLGPLSDAPTCRVRASNRLAGAPKSGLWRDPLVA
jgi:hypothetical protein